MGFAYHFDWGVLWRQPYGMWLLQGLWLTIKIGFLAWIIAFFLGIFVGTLRVTPWRWLRFYRRGLYRGVSQYSFSGPAVFLVLCRPHGFRRIFRAPNQPYNGP